MYDDGNGPGYLDLYGEWLDDQWINIDSSINICKMLFTNKKGIKRLLVNTILLPNISSKYTKGMNNLCACNCKDIFN